VQSRFFLSRLFPNRILDLSRRVELGYISLDHQASLSHFDNYNIATLRKLLFYLANFSHSEFSITLERQRYLLRVIKLAISLRSPSDTQSRADFFNIIQLPGLFQPGFDFLNLNNVFRAAAAHLPAGTTNKPFITSKYEACISSKFINTGLIAQMTPAAIQNVLNSPCPCQLATWSRYRHSALGHVCTNDYGCLPHPNLRHFAQMGSKYRTGLQSGTVTAGMRAEIHALSLDAFNSFAAKYENCLDIAGWDAWRAAIATALTTQLDIDLPIGMILPAPPAGDESTPLTFTPASLQALRQFHRHFAITLVDKMANSFAIVCKKQYLLWMMADLGSSTVFQLCTTAPATIISEIESKLAALHLTPTSPTFPSYSLTVKLHKAIPTPRFLVGAHNCINTAAAKELCHVAKNLDTFLPALLKDLFSTLPNTYSPSSFSWHGVSPVLKNAANMVDVVTAYNQQFQTHPVFFQSGDVSRLYTNIPLADLRTRLKDLYSLIFSTRGVALKIFNHERNAPKWMSTFTPPDRRTGGSNLYDRYKIYSLADIFRLIDFVLDNNYVQFGGQLFLQIFGIAMGGNASVFIANHFLFSYEYQFFQQLVTAIIRDPSAQPITSLPTPEPTHAHMLYSQGAVARFLLPLFIWLFRYIDDIGSINNPFLQQLLYTDRSFFGFTGIYPPVLDITLTPRSPTLKYLDIEIGARNENAKTPLQTTFYNKFSEPEFSHLPVIRYTHITSNLSRRCKWNILAGRFAALSQNLTSRRSFIETVAKVFVGLVQRGYTFGRLKRNLRQLCYLRSGLYGLSSQALNHRILFQARQSMENST
jgi:hypothetical protein